MRRTIIMWLAVMFCIGLLASGCGGDQKPAGEPGTQAGGTASGGDDAKGTGKGRTGKAAPSTPEAEAALLETSVPKWKYDPSNKWDPFIKPAPPVELLNPEGRYDLDQMMLLGVVVGQNSVAYLRMPNGRDKIVKVGDILGKHGGIVKEISKDFILVEEKYVNPQDLTVTFVIEKELKLRSSDSKKK